MTTGTGCLGERIPRWLVLGCCLALLGHPAMADEETVVSSDGTEIVLDELPTPQDRQPAELPGSVITLQVENDVFTTSDDGQYTHGMQAEWLSAPGDVADFIRQGADVLPLFNTGGDLRGSFTVGQSMYTPDDIDDPDVIANDRPYAGWLYSNFGLLSDTGQRLDKMVLSLGVVGPASFADRTQKWFHEVIDSPDPKGWSNQLHNEPTINLFYERQLRMLSPFKVLGIEGDLTPHYGGALGNAFTYGAVGATIRLGTDLVQDYGPPRIQPSLPGSGYFTPRGWDQPNAYLFAGVEGRAVARNIFLDGNTFGSSHSVGHKVFVGDLQFGAAITWGDMRLSLTHVIQTKEFDGEDGGDQFGAVSFSMAF
ncbi:MAG: lipid A deacylase LpxR family protein [Proteobacteria bacterium]|nr:lipid A deacylase LpxR family protein [Pseudomonadota bacterium]